MYILIIYRLDGFIKLLNKFVSIPTISGNPKFQQDCMRGARFLKNLFLTLGAESKLIHGAESRNPLVLAKFKANKKKAGFGSAFNTPKTPSQSSKLNTSSDSSKSTLESKTPHVLFYGHYDVIPVDESQWNYHPFKVTGANGYLYGRGVTDNKGPILATIFAIAELYQAKDLDVDITLVIEGEEESGSIGFYEAVRKHKNWIGNPDVILLR
jgi:di- and tripeptidase